MAADLDCDMLAEAIAMIAEADPAPENPADIAAVVSATIDGALTRIGFSLEAWHFLKATLKKE